MTHQTEAACLLESGALYLKRAGLYREGADPIFAGVKQAAFSLYYGDAPIYHFDLEGRWQRAFVAGTHYLKGLDASVQAIDRVREGENLVLHRRTLSFAEAADLDATVRTAALDVLEDLGAGQLSRVEPPPKAQPLSEDELGMLLETVAGWDSARWFAQREKYLETYGPLPILPPDCQNPVILQATLGHANGVTFGLARAAEHYVRSVPEFAAHAQAVAALLGRRVLQSRAVFLGGSDVLLRPADDVVGYLEAIANTFPIADQLRSRAAETRDAAFQLDGIHAFLDQFASPRPDAECWRRFAATRLRRVSVGIESGAPEIRALHGKNWTDEDFRATVRDLKAAGLGVGILLLVGAGGPEHADRHLDSTAALVESLPLGSGDLVSLLDANEVADRDAAPALTRLSGQRWLEQQADFKQRLAAWRSRTGAKLAPYSLEKQALS